MSTDQKAGKILIPRKVLKVKLTRNLVDQITLNPLSQVRMIENHDQTGSLDKLIINTCGKRFVKGEFSFNHIIICIDFSITG